MPDLKKGDFVYQSDQELFLVVIDEDEESYTFAVHGWRTIGKNRLDEYLEHQHGKLFDEEDLVQLVEEEGDDHDADNFAKFLELVEAYEGVEVDKDGMIDDYSLEDT